MSLGPSWAKKWLDRVKAKTGVTLGIYASKSVCFAYDWSSVAKTYPLWVAQYLNYEETGFLSEPWTDGWDFGAWGSPLIFQYSGTGRESWIHDYYSGHWGGILHYNGKADTGGASAPTGSGASSGDVSELAARVIAGEFGNGEAHKRRLGSYYSVVQRRVNEMLS